MMQSIVYPLSIIRYLINITSLCLMGYGLYTQVKLEAESWKPFSITQRILNFVSNTLVIASLLSDSDPRNICAMTLVFCALNVWVSSDRDSYTNMIICTSVNYLWLFVYTTFLDIHLLEYELLVTTICVMIIVYRISDMFIMNQTVGYPSTKNIVYIGFFLLILTPGLTLSRYINVYPTPLSYIDQYPLVAIAATIDYRIYTCTGRKIDPKMYIVFYIASCILRFFLPSTDLFFFFLYAVICCVVTIYRSKENLMWRNTRTYCCGVFDMMHEGHMELFRKMSVHGDVIVGILDDETVASYKRMPVMNHDERCKAVQRAKFVDDIILHCPLDTTMGFMDNYDIDVVGIGEEYFKPPYQYYKDCVESNRYVIVPRYTGISTSDLIKRINNRNDLSKNKQKDKLKSDEGVTTTVT